MPLTKATLQSTGMYGNPDQIGYINHTAVFATAGTARIVQIS